MSTLSIGTISSGTLRRQDLLPAYLFALEDCDQATATRYGMELVELGFGYSQCGVAFDDSNPAWTEHADTIDGIIEELVEHLYEHAPAYCYIGALEGDGADIGVWPDWDRIEMDEQDGELERINDAAELDYCNTSCAALLVNDHGNVTLFLHDGDRWEEIWAIV